jgi:hypothetical protein
VNSPLIEYALGGLEHCWLPQYGRWSHAFHLDHRADPNESIPHSDVFYTINVLLGLARVKQVPYNLDLAAIFQRNAVQLTTLPVAKYAFGCALWAAAELQLDVPTNVMLHVDALLSKKENWLTFRAQDLGMILIGVIEQAKIDPKRWSLSATELFDFLIERYQSPSGLFFDGAIGLRRQFSSFASQTYLTLACYAYGGFADDARAIKVANSCVCKLIEFQGPNGEWPWFFYAPSGAIVDFYEVYSVHQCGMAPAFLERAEHHGVPGAREALIRGFNWVFGSNQLGIVMLVPELRLTIRSQVRKGELSTNKRRALRALWNAFIRGRSGLADPRGLALRRECRSYELGWLLWSFGQRSDLPQLTEHRMFADSMSSVGR